jgi:predicted PurR-regulated permease PerM
VVVPPAGYKPPVTQDQLFAVFFFAVFLFLLYDLYLFLSAFFAPLVWAAILALTFYPLTTRLVRLVRGSRGIAAFILLIAVIALFIVPSILLGSVLAREAAGAYARLEQVVRSGELSTLVDNTLHHTRVGALWDRVEPLASRLSIDPSDVLLSATNWLSTRVVSQATDLASNVLSTLGNFVLMLVALFFFFRDGERMAVAIRRLIPMDQAHKDAVFQRLYDTLTAVVQSMVLTAVGQGTLAGIGYWLIGGFSFSVFLAFVTGLASFLPLAGPALIWGGAAIFLAATGHAGAGLGLALWGALVVSTADNFIKPLVIGPRANLPTFLLLFSLLGGLKVYGFLGVFLGPVVLAILLSFIDIYRELYQGRAASRAA